MSSILKKANSIVFDRKKLEAEMKKEFQSILDSGVDVSKLEKENEDLRHEMAQIDVFYQGVISELKDMLKSKLFKKV